MDKNSSQKETTKKPKKPKKHKKVPKETVEQSVQTPRREILETSIQTEVVTKTEIAVQSPRKNITY